MRGSDLGTPFADRITGDANPQTIRAGNGDDVVDGGGGVDLLSGEGGNDIINARDGKGDNVSCGVGTDSVSADPQDKVAKDCENVSRARPKV